jgi:hypothetical protein
VISTIEKIAGDIHIPGINWGFMALGACVFLYLAQHFDAE